MCIFLVNHSRHQVIYSIDDGNFIGLAPFDKVEVNCLNPGRMKVEVKHNYESTVQKHWSGSIYHLVIDSVFIFDNLTHGDEIQICREKIRFSMDAHYDRFFAYSMTAVLISEYHSISGAEKMKKFYHKKQRRGTLWDYFMEPLLDMIFNFELPFPFLPSALLVLGIVLGFINGWKFALNYFLIFYAVVFTANAIGKLLADKIDLPKMIFGSKSEIIEFPQYLTNDYIIRYYSSPNRTPFHGEYESE